MCKQRMNLFILLFSVASFASATSIVCPGKSGFPASAKFVYCGPAVCKPNSDGSTATCKDCYQLVGENVGTLSCEERVPKGNNYISSFSARKSIVPGHEKQPIVFCDANKNADTIYADCLNAPCTVTDNKKKLATCQCTLVKMEKGDSFATEARSCTIPDRCNAPKGYILNGAPSAIVLPMVATVAKVTGQSISDITCDPSQTPK